MGKELSSFMEENLSEKDQLYALKEFKIRLEDTNFS